MATCKDADRYVTFYLYLTDDIFITYWNQGDPTVKRTLLLVMLAAIPLSAQAEKGKSIMFGDQDPVYQERMVDTSADEQAAHCKALKQRINSLSLRPLSRNAAIQRYRLECEQNYGESRSTIGP